MEFDGFVAWLALDVRGFNKVFRLGEPRLKSLH